MAPIHFRCAVGIIRSWAGRSGSTDVLPINWSVFSWKFPLMILWPGEGEFYESIEAGISDATFYNWRKKYAGLMPSEMKRLRPLEEENAKLKRI
eukprot:gene19891-27211_t